MVGIAGYIDATLLKPEATTLEIRHLCTLAAQYGCAAVCVNPGWVEEAASCLEGSPVRVCTVVGFPLGALMTRQKLLELGNSMQAGAQELDLVVNLGWVKEGNWTAVAGELEQAVGLAHQGQGVLKAIIETGLLTDEEIITASRVVMEAGADFVKTSTGFAPRGASVADVRLIRSVVGDKARVKAAGGIKTLEFARQLLAAGADRLGISSFEAILREEASLPA